MFTVLNVLVDFTYLNKFTYLNTTINESIWTIEDALYFYGCCK